MTSRKRGFYIAGVKWRNQLLALFCLVVFFGFGIFYFRYWVVQKPFGIILFIGPGLEPARFAATRMYGGGADKPLALDSLPQTALLKNYSRDFATPDQAAAATALATGVKVNNGAIGIDANGETLENLMDLAQESGRMTGLVSNVRLTNPTAASFYAHTTEKDDRPGLAAQLAENASIDVVLGGGSSDFLPSAKGGERSDDRDLLRELRHAGYELIENLEELEDVPWWRRAKLFGLFGAAELALSSESDTTSNVPSLADMVRRSIELLQFNRGGYLLVIDAGRMRIAAEQNQAARTFEDMQELDRAVSVALEYAGTKSLILVCGDVGIGGMNVSGHPARDRSGAALLEPAEGGPRVTWATGPNGPKREAPAFTPPAIMEDQSLQAQPTISPTPATIAPAALFSDAAQNTAADIVAFGAGLGADALHGTIESTALFEIIRDNL